MRFIPTHLHGAFDYFVGVLLIFAPQIFGFQNGGAEDRIFVILGVMTLVYSLCTRYELGLFNLIPLGAHLVFDFVSGVVLTVSPWVFGFSERVWVPHLLIGLLAIDVALMSQRNPVEGAERTSRGIPI